MIQQALLIGGALIILGVLGYRFGLHRMLNLVPPKIRIALKNTAVFSFVTSRFTPPKVGFTLSDTELSAAQAFMAANPIIDSHAHPGRSFIKSARNLSFKIWLYKMLGGTFEDRTIADMRAGGVDGAVFNGVADIQLLTLGKTGLLSNREFTPGEAWASYRRQIADLQALETSGLATICRSASDVRTAKAAAKVGMFLAMEGADFLENDLSRLQQVYDDGVRMLTLVHYHNNTLGDIMTGEIGKRGLTGFGREVVQAMNATGLVVDMAHASEQTVLDAVSVAKKPIVITHTHINTASLSHPRFVNREVAQAVAETGGYIGAWPVGIDATTLAQFIDRIDFLMQIVGKDHVAIGSDMDANYKPVLETYRKMPLVVGALLKRGYTDETLAAIMGGNVLRVMEMAQAD